MQKISIRHLRKSKGYTMADLADKLGVSRQQVYNWEHNKHKPRNVDTLKKIAKSLDCSMVELVNYFYLEG